MSNPWCSPASQTEAKQRSVTAICVSKQVLVLVQKAHKMMKQWVVHRLAFLTKTKGRVTVFAPRGNSCVVVPARFSSPTFEPICALIKV